MNAAIVVTHWIGNERDYAHLQPPLARQRANPLENPPMPDLMADPAELFNQYSDNASFKKWLSEMIFAMTYVGAAAAPVNSAG